jgi:hypothetical protein
VVVLGGIGASGFKPPQNKYLFNTIISKRDFEPKKNMCLSTLSLK